MIKYVLHAITFQFNFRNRMKKSQLEKVIRTVFPSVPLVHTTLRFYFIEFSVGFLFIFHDVKIADMQTSIFFSHIKLNITVIKPWNVSILMHKVDVNYSSRNNKKIIWHFRFVSHNVMYFFPISRKTEKFSAIFK